MPQSASLTPLQIPTAAKLLAILKRGFLQASSYRLNFFGTYLSGLLTVVFMAVLATFISPANPAALAAYGSDYFTFLLIGVSFARFLSLGLRHFGRELEHELAVGTVEPILVTATPPALALLGPSLWVLLEGLLLLVIQLFLGAAYFGADFSQANWLSVLVLAVLTFLALNSWGLVSAAFVLNFKRAEPLSWLVDVTLFMLAGVYFPVTMLPPLLRFVAYLLPLSHALEGLRLAMMRGHSLPELWRVAVTLVAFNAFLLPAGLLTFRAGLDRVRRTGTLSHY